MIRREKETLIHHKWGPFSKTFIDCEVSQKSYRFNFKSANIRNIKGRDYSLKQLSVIV